IRCDPLRPIPWRRDRLHALSAAGTAPAPERCSMTCHSVPRVALVVATLLLGACASVPADRGRAQVEQLLAPRAAAPALPAASADEAPLAQSIEEPLDAD